MRITKERIASLTKGVLAELQAHDLLEVTGSKDQLVMTLEKAITHEVSVEDRLNAEVRDLLKQYEREFQSGRADYQKMFSMVKNKLIREREITL